MKKICFLINSMEGGGTERVLSILLKNLPKNSREFFLAVLEDKFQYSVPGNVRVIKFSSELGSDFKRFFAIFSAAIKLKRAIKKNKIDIVISFLERSNYINILARGLGSGHKTYISERCNAWEYYSDRSLKSFFHLFMIKRLYKKADLIIANSGGVKDSLIKNFPLNAEKIKIIYNPIDVEEINSLSQGEVKDTFSLPVVITVGRLIKEKGHDYLIKAFSQLRKELPEINLLILGEGKEEKNLKNLVRELDLENRVFFLGWQDNPFKFLSKSKIFVLSSLTEGFPNSLIEALACGIPAVSFDCPSGPNEIIKNGENGILVPLRDEKALVEAMLKILRDPVLAQKLSQQGRERARDFSLENIICKYEQIL